jgi:hypothetical protein
VGGNTSAAQEPLTLLTFETLVTPGTAHRIISRMCRTIDVSDLPEPVVAAIESMMRTSREKVETAAPQRAQPRPIGWLKGEWELPELFFDPLPHDLLDLFQGTGA